MFFFSRAIKIDIWLVLLLSVSMFFVGPPVLSANSHSGQVKIGVLAKRGTQKAMEKWGPTAQYLTKTIQNSNFIIVPLNFEEVHTSVINAGIDFLVTNSGYYVLLEENHGLSRIATLRNRWHHIGYQTFGGVIFTRKDNRSINKYLDLKDMIFMAVDPNSFGGWLMARFEFHKQGINFKTDFKALKFGGTHDNVVFSVRDKIADAGIVRTDTLERMAAEGKINLKDFKILHSKPKNSSFPFLRSTDLYPEWPFAKLPHTSNHLSEQVSIALLNMPAQSSAAIAAKITGWTVPLDYRLVHQLMKELKIGRYQDLGKITLMDIVRKYLVWIIISIFVIAVMAGIFLYVTILNKNLKTARLELERANDELENKVDKRTKELLESQRKLTLQLEFERLLSELSAEFVNLSLDGINTAIEKWLLKLVEFIKVDRGALLQIQESQNKLVATHSVGVRGTSLLKTIQVDDALPWISGQIKKGETLIFSRLPDDMPKEAAADYHFIVREGILSNFMTPLKAEGQLLGSISFGSFSRYVDWPEELGPRLKLVGEVFANAIVRQKNAEKNRKLQKQLRQTQKMEAIGTLAGGIAHDFNNILSSIFGFTELAQISLKEGADIEGFLEKIMDAGIRARDLVQHLLIFSRKAVIVRKPIELLPILKEAVKFIRASLPTTIEIREDIRPVGSKINADPTQIHQVLMNLFTNAGHSMKKKGGVLSIRFEECDLETDDLLSIRGIKKGRYNKLTISDTGYGISKDIIDKIFDPFFTTKKSGEGTGMGLSTVHGIVKDMGGSISVYSEEGKGTAFHVLFPVHTDAGAQKAPDKDYTPRKGSETILIVDDEENILVVVQGFLEDLGYRVIVSNSSIEALERFKQAPGEFNLVLTDLTMPNMTGLDLAKHLKKVRFDIPIILCTGFSEQIKQEDLVEAGISSLIMKPVIRKDLFRAIEIVLDK